MTTADVARILKVSVRRIRALCENGKLVASKQGRDWWITDDSLQEYVSRKQKTGSKGT